MSTHPHILTPKQSLSAASAVYGLKKGYSVKDSFEDSLVDDLFEFSKSTGHYSAESGIFEFKQNAGFAAMAMGKEQYKNHAILICRGTDGSKDWLSDLNIGMQISTTGHIVHAGFNRIYEQFNQDMMRYIRKNKASTIHCVGHSLGGALANMAAETIISSGRKARLYTYGAPRVGTMSFASRLSRNPMIGTKNIFRVYHSSDPVSMVPFFPFVHAPQPGGEYYLNKILTINPWDHKISAYNKSMENVTSWNEIRNPHPTMDAHIQKWINSDETWRYCGLNIYNLGMALGAIRLLIKDTLTQGWNIAGGVATAGATFLDQLSIAVSEASKKSKEKEGIIMSVLKRIMNMLGIKVSPKESLTIAFIQFVFRSLTFAVNRSVRIALS